MDDQVHILGNNNVHELGSGLSNYVALVNSLDEFAWYHGDVSKNAAEKLLIGCIPGTFLVRESESHPGQWTVSLKRISRVTHYRIEYEDGKMYMQSSNRRFNTLPELVYGHSIQPEDFIPELLYPASKPMATVSPEPVKWEIKLYQLGLDPNSVDHLKKCIDDITDD